MTAHNRIKELRNKKGLSQKEFARAFSDFIKNDENVKPVSYATISRWERGENEPKLETWLRLADFFDVSASYLQGISDVKSSDFTDHLKSITDDKGFISFNSLGKVVETYNEDKSVKAAHDSLNKIIENSGFDKKAYYDTVLQNLSKDDFLEYEGLMSVVQTVYLEAKGGNKNAIDAYERLNKLLHKSVRFNDDGRLIFTHYRNVL